MVAAGGGGLRRDDARASDWSAVVALTGGVGKVRPYFNRGIVAAQWLSRKLTSVPPTGWRKRLGTSIATPGDPIRDFLSGYLRDELVKLLKEADRAGGRVYAVLYELNDPELIAALKGMGPRAGVILANGTHKAKAGEVDENAAARKALRGVVDLSDRMVTGNHLAHNKFLVFAGADGTPRRVWTGSTNWTESGLCTQANNGILFDDPAVAALFKDQWDVLKGEGGGYSKRLLDSNTRARSAEVEGRRVSVWFAPVRGGVDLDQARALIRGAKQGVLFLMFNPGPKGTLLNDILGLDADKVYIHGVANQDPGGSKAPVIKLVHRGRVVTAPAEVALPAAIDARLKFWQPEMKGYSLVMVHSKLIVVDPFGDHPVVMTGSHNLGPKASSTNDDNLVIVEGDPDLAAQYAVNVMTVYNQYRWRYSRLTSKTPNKWDGLARDDHWQDGYFDGDKARELDFWLGDGSPPTPARRSPAAGASAGKKKAARPKAALG
jgi:phosphatidylserine/phosphatidylglycerophosphate/cardiolipin synthase-like enzyme